VHDERQPSDAPVLRDKAFLLLVVAVSLAFGWILRPFYGAIFWAVALAVLFAPLYRRLLASMRRRRTLAALVTLVATLVIAILPAALITEMLLQEAFGLYKRIQSGELDFGRYLQQVLGVLPGWVTEWLERFGLTSFGAVQERLAAGLMRGIQVFGSQAVNVGQVTLDFVVSFFIMLYLLFFLLRDGQELAARIRSAIPLEQNLQHDLFAKFVQVIRATIKGNVVVAVLQGALGGLIFWLLGINAPVFWGVLMAFLSLLPAVGTALVWLPVAIYFLVTGALWQGVVLIAYGVLVIGLVDNVVRPILVGKDIRMPDYLVLISTLGGMAIFGFNGFIIGPAIAALFVAVWATVAASKSANRPEP
jgi:predicted PurR-regulated permease PerM